VASERGTLLAVDLQLSAELVAEGLAREAVNTHPKLAQRQRTRKSPTESNSGFQVTKRP